MKHSEFSGLRNDRAAERFTESDLSTAQNVDIDNSGAIALRGGQTLSSAGAKHSLWADASGTIGLYVAGTTLYRLNPDLTGTSVMTGLTADSPMSYKHVNERVYFSNGQQSGIYENGVARSWGLPVPPLPGVSVTVGGLLVGAYQYCLTYSRNDGQESGARLAGRIDITTAGGGLNFTLPVSTDPTVVAKNLYLSARNGDLLYLVTTVPNAQTTASYVGTTAELNLPLESQYLSAPPSGQIVGHYRGRMYVASGDVLYPSEPFAFERFDLRKGMPMNGRITMIASFDDIQGSGMFVGTDKGCGILIGSDLAEFVYVPKIDYGAIEGTLVYVDGSLFADDSAGARMLPVWLTTQGICVGLPSMEIRNMTRTKYKFNAAGRGAGVFIPSSNKLILSSNF